MSCCVFVPKMNQVCQVFTGVRNGPRTCLASEGVKFMMAGKVVVSPALGGDTLFRPYSLFTVGGGGGNGEGGGGSGGGGGLWLLCHAEKHLP